MHGAGADIVQVGDQRVLASNGGIGSITAPTVGTIIVLPVMSKASGGSSSRTYTIAGWVEVLVNPGCKKQHCDGKVQGPISPPAGITTSTTGGVQPPATFAQVISYGGLIQ